MRKFIYIILFACTTSIACAQTKVTINKTNKNAVLFDDSTPNSLFGLLKTSYENLGYFDVEGMSNSLVKTLSGSERAKLYASSTNDVYIPLDEYGEVQVVYNPHTKTYEEAYVYPDTVFTSLENIERIVLNITEGDGTNFSRIETIEFWRKYNGIFHRVMTISAEVLALNGFKYLEPVPDEIQMAWLDKSNPSGLWNKMKKESLETFERQKEKNIDEEIDFSMNFFPTNYDFFFHYFVTSSAGELGKDPEKVSYLQARNYFKKDQFPFQLSYGDALYLDSNKRQGIEGKFLSAYPYWIFSDEPLIDGDPNSPYFADPVTKVNNDGTIEYVYPDPILAYAWLDYENVQFFALKKIGLEENDQGMLSRIVGLVCTQKSKTGKPEVVSYLYTDGPFKSYFESYPITKLNDLPWYTMLQKEVENKKNAK